MNLFNDDFRDFILAFNKANVDYILVGGFSVEPIVSQQIPEDEVAAVF